MIMKLIVPYTKGMPTSFLQILYSIIKYKCKASDLYKKIYKFDANFFLIFLLTKLKNCDKIN